MVLHHHMEASSAREIEQELGAHAQAIAGALEAKEGAFDLELSDEYLRYFHQKSEGAPYYVLWDSNGEVIDRSSSRVNVDRPAGPGTLEKGHFREVAATGPSGCLILVGRGIHETEERQHEFLRELLATGGAILVLALAGGWVLAARALRPIARISETSSRISAQDLGRRIETKDLESELEELAKVLNGMFERLQDAFERQARFTADASHELRTPLSILLSHMDLALRRDRSAAEYREAIETGQRAALRMKAVVDGLLTLARADSGALNLERTRVDLREIAQETIALVTPQAREREVVIELDAREEVAMEGDRERLRQVLMNLLANAIRYNREGGRVDLRLCREDARAILSVEDTGIGIPAAQRAHIFERFYRIDEARSRELGGVGLGLAITKWIVEAHGGRIGFESREGMGTTFRVELPARSIGHGVTP